MGRVALDVVMVLRYTAVKAMWGLNPLAGGPLGPFGKRRNYKRCGKWISFSHPIETPYAMFGRLPDGPHGCPLRALEATWRFYRMDT